MEEKKTERLPLVVSKSFLERLDRWRAAQPGVPTRSEAMRRLAEAGMDDGAQFIAEREASIKAGARGISRRFKP